MNKNKVNGENVKIRLLRLTVYCLFILLPCVAPAGPAPYSTLVLFGDSLTDIGNTYIATSDAGRIPPSPDPSWYPLIGHYLDDSGDDGIGDSYGEILWRALNLPGDMIPSFAGGSNYAVGGSRSRYGSADMSNLSGPPAVGTPSLAEASIGSFWGQLNMYLPTFSSTADPLALYTVMIGSNDVSDIARLAALSGDTSADPDGLFAQSVSDVVAGVARLVGAGARNVAVASVSDPGVTPAALATELLLPGSAAALTGLALSYNTQLKMALNAALGGIEDLNLWYIDTFYRFGEILADPSRFGIDNVADACLIGYFVDTDTDASRGPSLCDDPARYAFYDEVHPTSSVHAVIASRFLAVVTAADVPAPAPGVLLLSILPMLMLRRLLIARNP